MSLRAKLVVEGYLVGRHKSPYHGFSVEFAEHRSYGQGDEIRHMDWKLYGKTDLFFRIISNPYVLFHRLDHKNDALQTRH